MNDFSMGIDGQPDSTDFIRTLQANASRQTGLNRMTIAFIGSGIIVMVNDEVTYSHDLFFGSLGSFLVQSHWGSGVTFSNMSVNV
ncbi:hypothetical protein Q31b_23450 [Novipirellula aureliae]|uniref:Uncharacterized protein n=1 Tax=Novipirellula aureliae TaxID=2527966 RepID=A0A5C6E5S4_9BACT|nr:hypothetical protein Q31b_23450 [Novipirellula aureliae]